jgi:hypothetical protein
MPSCHARATGANAAAIVRPILPNVTLREIVPFVPAIDAKC